MTPEQEVQARYFRLEEVLHFLVDTADEPVERIFSHLATSKLKLGHNYVGIFDAYPGADLSAHAFLCRHITRQHPSLDLPLPTGQAKVLDWLLDTDVGRELGCPDDYLPLTSLGPASLRKHLIAVTVDGGGEPVKVWAVRGKNSIEHRIDGWSAGAPTAALYYLEAWSFEEDGGFALAVRPSGEMVTFWGKARDRRHPFSEAKPVITQNMLQLARKDDTPDNTPRE